MTLETETLKKRARKVQQLQLKTSSLPFDAVTQEKIQIMHNRIAGESVPILNVDHVLAYKKYTICINDLDQ
jgi:hypothetical protein